MVGGIFGGENRGTPGRMAACASDSLTAHGRRTERTVAGQVGQRNVLGVLVSAHTRNIHHIIRAHHRATAVDILNTVTVTLYFDSVQID